MVGIVIVSHSPDLAKGVKDLAELMTQGQVPIAVAGGIDDAENPIGTDAMKIMEAIEAVYDDNDIVVLMDMGSAFISTKMAIDFLPEALQQRVHLCPAPIVEGAVAAALQSMLGADVQSVINEARNALIAKIQQLGIENEASEAADKATQLSSEAIDFQVVIPNKHGLHARPASKLIQLTQGLDLISEISKNKTAWFSAKSLNNLLLLGAGQGETLYFKADGNDKTVFQKRINDFVSNNFGDDDTEEEIVLQRKQTYDNQVIHGIPSSKGIAVAQSRWLQNEVVNIPDTKVENIDDEIEKFTKAIAQTHTEILQRSQQIKGGGKEIFEAHLLFLHDEAWLTQVRKTIAGRQISAAKAWFDLTENSIAQYRTNTNEYIQQRATDIKDIQLSVLHHLGIRPDVSWDFEQPILLLANNLQPSEILKLDTTKVKAIVLREGNENAHTAILARSLGITAITGVGERIDEIPLEKTILADGNTGEILTDEKHPLWKSKIEKWNEIQQKTKLLQEQAQQEAVTRNGIPISVKSNISGIADSQLSITNGSDGVGLFRTELYFMNREEEPSEDEQVQLYSEVASLFGSKTVTIRTLDVGGDKPIPFLPSKAEENPFLGLRGIRFTMMHQAVFKRQIRAILRTAATHNVQIMFPMISVFEEWQQAKQLVEICRQELKNENAAHARHIACGMMVEVPSVLFRIDDFAKEVDFFSVGTNDLSQYLLASDRGNADVKNIIKNNSDIVIDAIAMLCSTAKKYNKPVSVCGELGASIQHIEKLLNVGVSSLSVNALQIPEVKSFVRTLEVTV